MSATICSTSVTGGSAARVAGPTDGSAERSILPFAVRGRDSSVVQTSGTYAAGRLVRSSSWTPAASAGGSRSGSRTRWPTSRAPAVPARSRVTAQAATPGIRDSAASISPISTLTPRTFT
jgi:hypothetical protein